MEKLLNACLGGAIPVYFGEIDDIDKKIFNMKRILTYDSEIPATIDAVQEKIRLLWHNKDDLLEFYKQPVFTDDAFTTCEEMKAALRSMIH